MFEVLWYPSCAPSFKQNFPVVAHTNGLMASIHY